MSVFRQAAYLNKKSDPLVVSCGEEIGLYCCKRKQKELLCLQAFGNLPIPANNLRFVFMQTAPKPRTFVPQIISSLTFARKTKRGWQS